MNTSNPVPPDDGYEGNEPPSDDILAGEYVLGVLDASERRAVQSRIETDRAFSGQVQAWERRLASLLTDIEPVPPPTHAWPGICRRLGWVERETTPGLSPRFWRAATAVSTVIAIAAISFAVGHLHTVRPIAQARGQTAPKPVTLLADDHGLPAWLASVDAMGGTVLMIPVPSAADPQGRVPELWLIPAGQQPRSLGAVSTNESYTVTVPQNARSALVAGSVLAITLEVPAGIPHAAPTGAIIAKGKIAPGGAAS